MRKVQLQLESLVVESFHTTDPAQAQGTVVAHATTPRDSCGNSCQASCIQTACTCPGIDTCWQSCNGTCDFNSACCEEPSVFSCPLC